MGKLKPLLFKYQMTAEENSAKETQLRCTRGSFFQEDAVSHLVAHNRLLTASVTMSTGWFVWFKWTLKQAEDFKVKQTWTTSSCVDAHFFFCTTKKKLCNHSMCKGLTLDKDRGFKIMCKFVICTMSVCNG